MNSRINGNANKVQVKSRELVIPSMRIYWLCDARNLKWLPSIAFNVRKATKIRNRYNQIPHLTQDITWESHKKTRKTYKKNKSQEVSPFPAGDHKAAMNRRESMNTQDINNTHDPQKKYRLGTVSKIFNWRA